MLPLSIQYLPSSHRPVSFSVLALYCTFMLKEKDTQFPLAKLKDSTVNPAATVLPSPFVLLSSCIKGCVLSCLLPGRHPDVSSACSPSSLVLQLLLGMKLSSCACTWVQ